jgi:hypothetical protein
VFADQVGKALASKEVLFVGDIAKTPNAKVLSRIVRAGHKLGDRSAFENLASLEGVKRTEVMIRTCSIRDKLLETQLGTFSGIAALR